MATSFFDRDRGLVPDVLDSLSDAIAIRDAIFHNNRYRQSEAYFRAVKIFGRQLTKDELCIRLVRILHNYNYEQTKSVILSGSYQSQNGVLTLVQTSQCISCPLNCGGLFRTAIHTKNPACPYYKFLLDNKLIK